MNKDKDFLIDDELLDEAELEEDDELLPVEKDEEEQGPIKVIFLEADEKIRVEHKDGRFIEGHAYPDFFTDRHIRTMITPPKVRVKGKQDTIAYLNNKYNPKTDQTLYILKQMLTSWSEDKNISEVNILSSRKLNQLFYEFVDKFKEINDMNPEDEEKK
ncbi:MAG: hypothetical protein MI740_10505 [Halanaerobiales bacterium]|nr:hypothetical protein [Halanaerobiales bacterium]